MAMQVAAPLNSVTSGAHRREGQSRGKGAFSSTEAALPNPSALPAMMHQGHVHPNAPQRKRQTGQRSRGFVRGPVLDKVSLSPGDIRR